MKRRFFSGNSIEQAALLAARHFGVDPSQVAYKQLEKKHGFLRVRRKVVIEVDPENPLKPTAEVGASAPPEQAAEPRASHAPQRAAEPEVGQEASPATPPEEESFEEPATVEPAEPPRAVEPAEPPQAVEPAEPPQAVEPAEPSPTDAEGPEIVDLPQRPRAHADRFPPATGAVALAAEKAVRMALDFVGQGAAGIEARQGESRLEIEVLPADSTPLLADDGRLLMAIQHLAPRFVRGFIGESVPLRVDCDDFHHIRDEQLRDVAQRAAAEVRQRGRAWTLKPMPPEERRIVHLTLKDDPAVTTDSVGDGYFKRVRVRPV